MGQLIYDNTLSSAVTSVTLDLSSTPIEKGELYEMTISAVNTSGSTSSLSIYANNNKTATNYYYQRLTANNTSVSSTRVNSAIACYVDNNERNTIKMNVRLTNDGYFVCQSRTVYGAGTALEYYDANITSTFTSSSVTQIDFVAGNSNGISTGSRIQIYKVAKKVDEVEVTGSAVTSVQFSGLSIGKGNEYLLVSDWNSVSTSGLNIFINNNLTSNNYYSQYLFADSTSVYGGRDNNANFTYSNSSFESSIITKLKLTNDGYFTHMSNAITAYTSPSSFLSIRNYYGTSTFTSNSITQIDLVNTTGSYIDAGSRFELYKLI